MFFLFGAPIFCVFLYLCSLNDFLQDKYIIPEEAKSWVFTTMSDQFRSHKSRIKRNYYTKYATDEERLENRPRDVSLEDWKILLAYWSDEKIKVQSVNYLILYSLIMCPLSLINTLIFDRVCSNRTKQERISLHVKM